MPQRMHKSTKDFLKLIAAEGWSMTGISGGSHIKVQHHPSGERTQIAFTPSNRRSRRDELTRLRRRVWRSTNRRHTARESASEGSGNRG